MHATSTARHHRPSVVCRKRAIPLADSSVVRADPANTSTYILEHVGTEKRREKVVVLRELQRVIIYTRELSKQAIEGHVSTAFIGFSVNEGARLTEHTVAALLAF
jgi:hypothetical protein